MGKRVPQDKLERIVELRREGKTMNDIIIATRTSANVVHRTLDQAGLAGCLPGRLRKRWQWKHEKKGVHNKRYAYKHEGESEVPTTVLHLPPPVRIVAIVDQPSGADTRMLAVTISRPGVGVTRHLIEHEGSQGALAQAMREVADLIETL